MPDALAGVAAVAGIGETDYRADYAAHRAGTAQPRSPYAYAAEAYRRALADAGLAASEVDGLIAGPPLAYERTAEILGVSGRFGASADHAQALLLATMAIATGAAECVALVYGNDQRSAGVSYGGAATPGASEILAYAYYAPWGLTSQGALYALMARRYMELHGLTQEALGRVAVHQRRLAARHPAAIMQRELSIEDYLAAPYIAEPLRLFDYCLVNDGGVCLIVTAPERARRAVTVAGIARSDDNDGATALKPRLVGFYHRAHREAARAVYDAAGVGPDDIRCVQIYDSFSIHVPVALEGFGYFAEGEAEGFLRGGALDPGGLLSVNTAGGHLSGSYMQGWGHQVEAVRRVRDGAEHVHYISDVAGKVTTVIYGKGDGC
jgi:acetyl-CoA acetyltransferase